MRKILICVALFVFLLARTDGVNGAGTAPDYTLESALGTFDSAELDKIHNLLTACADVMEFDSKNPDFDALMVYILHSHENFRLLTDIEPKAAAPQSSRGNIALVGSEFVDYIVKNIFNLAPEHPRMSELSERGFAYSDGYYYYKDNFLYYSTENVEISDIYSLGGGVYYVVFSDVYTENDVSKPESSYAVIKKGGGFGYQILRIGMGLEPLPEDEVLSYAPPGSDEVTPEPSTGGGFKIPFFIGSLALGAAGVAAFLGFLAKKAGKR